MTLTQAWEYVPLGPFNGKNFGTTISPWVVTFDALEPFATELPERQVPILDYLKDPSAKPGFSARLDVLVVPNGGSKAVKVLESDTKYLYWSLPQMLAHHTVGGCPMNPGDLLGSGTISGPDESSLGSFLEMSYDGKKEWEVDGQKRTFVEDGDEVIFVGYAGEGVGFGECRGKIKAADPIPG
jgi:fumarylacetoacetase